MLEALIADQTDAATMAALAKGRLRSKLQLLQQALTGVVDAQHRFLLAQHLVHIDFLDEQIHGQRTNRPANRSDAAVAATICSAGCRRYQHQPNAAAADLARRC